MKTLSLRARLTLWYTLALLVMLLLFGVNVLVAQKRLGIRRTDRELDSVHVTLANVLREELRELDSPALAATEEDSRGRDALVRRASLRAAGVRALQVGLALLAIAAGVLLATHPDALANYVAAHTTAVAAALAIGSAALAIVSGVTAELEAG